MRRNEGKIEEWKERMGRKRAGDEGRECRTEERS